MSYHLLALGCLSASGALMSWSDMVYRRLPNVVTGIVALGGIVTSLTELGFDQMFSNLLHMLIALGIGFIVFATSLIGSGDAKYYAAVAAWFPLVEALQLIGWVALAGFLVTLVWLVHSRLDRPSDPEDQDFGRVPFGVAIAAGSILAITSLLR